MNIIVCIKRVPQTAEAEVKIDSSAKDIQKDRLTFDMNESDTYALEEAVLLKEKHGGSITAISAGDETANEVLRIALSKGADAAIRIKAEDFDELDGYKVSSLLKSAIGTLEYDLVLTGCIATDDGASMVGITLAEMLGIPHATFVVETDVNDTRINVNRELEGGLLEHLDISLPSLLTIQTGLNEPRYASLIAIRRAAKKEITQMGIDEISEAELKINATIEELFVPPVTKQAEIFAGSPAETSGQLTAVLKEKGLV